MLWIRINFKDHWNFIHLAQNNKCLLKELDSLSPSFLSFFPDFWFMPSHLAAAKNQNIFMVPPVFLPWTANTLRKWYLYISLCMWSLSFHGRASIAHSSAPPPPHRPHRVDSSRPVTSPTFNGRRVFSLRNCVAKINNYTPRRQRILDLQSNNGERNRDPVYFKATSVWLQRERICEREFWRQFS